MWGKPAKQGLHDDYGDDDNLDMRGGEEGKIVMLIVMLMINTLQGMGRHCSTLPL